MGVKKFFKITGIILLTITFVLSVVLIYLSKRPAVSDGYITNVQTGGEIEAKYLAMG